MGKSINTLVDDIYNILDEQTHHEASEDNVKAAGESFKQLLRTRFKKREIKKGEGALRFSSLGKSDTQIWYAANMPEKAEPLPPKTMFKFLYGDVIEILLIFLAKEAGHEVTHEQHEVEEDGITGHTDCVIDGVCTDVKSASSYAIEKFKSGSFVFDDPFGYVYQLAGYANKLETEKAAFLVCDKVHGDIVLAPLDEVYIRGNPPGPRIAHLKKVIAMPDPPKDGCCGCDCPEGKSGNRKLNINSSYCAYKYQCYPGLRKFYYSRGPVFLTHVAKEPKVEEA